MIYPNPTLLLMTIGVEEVEWWAKQSPPSIAISDGDKWGDLLLLPSHLWPCTPERIFQCTKRGRRRGHLIKIRGRDTRPDIRHWKGGNPLVVYTKRQNEPCSRFCQLRAPTGKLLSYRKLKIFNNSINIVHKSTFSPDFQQINLIFLSNLGKIASID